MTGERALRVVMNGTSLLSPLTGIGNYVYHLADSLQKLADVRLRLFYGSEMSPELRQPGSPLAGQARAAVRRYVPNAYGITRFLRQRRFTKALRQQPADLYHEPNYLALPFDGPSVLTVHDLSWIRYPQTHPAERVRAMDRWFEPALRQASRVITDSEYVRQEVLAHYGLDPKKVQAIALGLDPLFHPRSPAQTLGTLQGLDVTHGRYFLTVGTLEPRKNIKTTLAAYAALPAGIRKHFPLVFAGLRGWHATQIEPLLAPLVARGEVRVLGYLPREQLADVTAGALALLYPSLYEGFGLPPLEAMGCAVPPVISKDTCLTEVAGDAGMAIGALDVDGLVTAMTRIAQDGALREQLAVRALARAGEFSWQRCASETMQTYTRAVSSR